MGGKRRGKREEGRVGEGKGKGKRRGGRAPPQEPVAPLGPPTMAPWSRHCRRPWKISNGHVSETVHPII